MALVDGILNSQLSEPSKTQYMEKLALLTKMVGKPLSWVVDNPKPVIAAISKRYAADLTRRAFVAAIKAVYHHNPELKSAKAQEYDEYTEFQNRLSQAVSDRYMSAEPTEKERANWVPWPEVLAKEQELARTEYGSYDHLLLAMYCLIEPLRQDYGALRILVEREPAAESHGNFLVIARNVSWGKLVLNSYKTARKYGTFTRDLPPRLLAIIRASLLAHPRAYLFVDESGAPYRKANSFTQFSNRTLRRIFKKQFTVSLMRHSHISNIDFNSSTPGELFEKSKNMAHSISTQQLYRRRVEPAPPLVVVKQPSLPSQPLQPSQPSQPSQPAPPTGAQGVSKSSDGHMYVTLSI